LLVSRENGLAASVAATVSRKPTGPGGEAPKEGDSMQYAAHLPSSRTLIAPVVALALGAAGATGIYALSDGTDVQLQPERVIVVEKSQSSAAGKNEAATAAAIGKGSQGTFSKNEAATAAAIGKGEQPQLNSQFRGRSAVSIQDSTTGARP
jgi:hypothetical protein